MQMKKQTKHEFDLNYLIAFERVPENARATCVVLHNTKQCCDITIHSYTSYWQHVSFVVSQHCLFFSPKLAALFSNF